MVAQAKKKKIGRNRRLKPSIMPWPSSVRLKLGFTLGARITEVKVRFLLLTVQTNLLMYEDHPGSAKPRFVCAPGLFFTSPFLKRISTQVQFVQTCLDCISVKLHEVIPVPVFEQEIEFLLQNPFLLAAKLLPQSR